MRDDRAPWSKANTQKSDDSVLREAYMFSKAVYSEEAATHPGVRLVANAVGMDDPMGAA